MSSVALNLVLSEARVFTGEKLNANILLDSADPDTVVQEFMAEVRGVSRTGWVNIHTDKIYETEQEFFNIVMPLCQSMMLLRPGRHRFELHVIIPENVPSSFESQFGSIRYTIKLSVLSNAEHSSIMEIFPFFVVSRSFFEDVPQAIMQPIDYRDEIDFTVCTLPFGTVHLQIALPRTAFCLGESIAARIHVRNATRKAVKDCRLHLLLKTQFEATSRYEHANDRKLIEQIVDTWIMGQIKARTEKNFDNCCLRIPPTAIPTHTKNQATTTFDLTTSAQSGLHSFTTPGIMGNNATKLAALMFQQNPLPLPISSSQMSSTNVDNENRAVCTGVDGNIIVLSYVLRFTALPGIETEIPLVITTEGFRKNSTGIRLNTDRSVNSKIGLPSPRTPARTA